jgi:hypothetical protein
VKWKALLIFAIVCSCFSLLLLPLSLPPPPPFLPSSFSPSSCQKRQCHLRADAAAQCQPRPRPRPLSPLFSFRTPTLFFCLHLPSHSLPSQRKKKQRAMRKEASKIKTRRGNRVFVVRKERRGGGGEVGAAKPKKTPREFLFLFFNCAAYFFPLCLSILKEQRVGWGPSARQKVKGKKRMKKDLKRSTKLSMS